MGNSSNQPDLERNLDVDDSLLSPTALRVTPDTNISLAVWGYCQAEAFGRLLDSVPGFRADMYAFSSGRHDLAPSGSWLQYDAVVIKLPLRPLLRVPEENRNDLSYVRKFGDYQSVLDATRADLTSAIDRALTTIGNAIPILFLSYFEPPATYQGILLNGRRKSFYHLVRSLNDYMVELLEPIANAHYVEINDLIGFYGTMNVVDTYRTHFTHDGFQASEATERVFRAIAERIRTTLIVLRNEHPVKLIVTDLDNTIWRGVLAEEDDLADHERVEGWPLGYMEALLEFKRRGGLLAICSKNDDEQTRQRALKLWQGALGFEDFCSVRINWDPKPKNILEILAETNILASNTLFIDDSAHEIHEVTSAIPGIRCLSGNPESWRSIILNSAETQVAFVSHESMDRTETLQMKLQRDLAARTLDRDEYLQSLKIRVKVDSISDAGHPQYRRAVELLNKTNQFNTTGRRWGLSDLQAHFAAGGLLITLSATDTFGDNGLVSLAVVLEAEIVQFVLSCRVFGLSLESGLLCRVLETLRGERGSRIVKSRHSETALNNACGLFYANHGFRKCAELPDVWEFEGDIAWPAWIQRQE